MEGRARLCLAGAPPLFAALLWGCSDSSKPQPPALQEQRASLFRPAAQPNGRLSEADRVRCVETGGFVDKPRTYAAEGCFQRFADVGRSCRDGSECAGRRCLAVARPMVKVVVVSVRDPRPPRGQCVGDDRRDGGCPSVLIRGKVGSDEPCV